MIKKLQEKGIIKIVVFAVVLLIPVIYSFFYLKSYWDPYGHLSDITVGIVNLDNGVDGKNRGEEFIQGLKGTKTFNFVDVKDSNEATTGLGEDKYYAVITIPSNFTETINSAGTNNKQVSTITYTPNKRKNYLASQILNSALKTVELNLESKISKEVTATLSDSLKDVPDSLEKIADGADKLNEGATSLSDGLQTLSDGVGTLDSKYSEFNNGVESAYKGSESLSDGINQVNTGISNLSDGANTLDSATSQVYDGVNKLAQEGGNGIEKLTSGIDTLDTAADSLSDGVSQYVSGAESLADGVNKYVAGTEQVASGTCAYVDGAEKLATNTSAYLAGTMELNSNKSTILKKFIEASKDNPELATLAYQAQGILDKEEENHISEQSQALKAGADELIAKNSQTNLTSGQMLKAGASQLITADSTGYSASQRLKAGANMLVSKDENGMSVGEKLKTGAAALSQGTSTLKERAKSLYQITNGIGTLESALEQISNGTTSLANGAQILKQGNTKVSDGANTLTTGLKTLSDSSLAVKDALTRLNSGAVTALDGSRQLQEGTETFKNEINSGLETAKEEVKKVDGLDEYVQDPVKIEEESYGEVDSYGVAFAPLFISIGLWVGALMCYVVLYYDQRHRFGLLDHDTNKSRILQNAIYLVIGAVDGIITGLILKAGLGYSVVNMGAYIGECMLAGLVFMAIIQFLIRNFGDVGKFLALIILVLQLAASGGTFPVETIDNGFKGFTSILPMTYTIRAFRDTLISTNHSLLGENTWILIGILVAIIALGTVAEVFKANISKNKTTTK